MSVDTNNTELKKGADLATIAEQRDDQRQQAEAEAAQEVLQRMQDTAAEDEKRRAHEEAEAKRKAEWEQKQRKKAEAEQAAWENAVAMGDDEVMIASMKRVGDDAERLTRRNMKQCVTEHIQTKCLSEVCPAGHAPPQEYDPLFPLHYPQSQGVCRAGNEGQRRKADRRRLWL